MVSLVFLGSVCPAVVYRDQCLTLCLQTVFAIVFGIMPLMSLSDEERAAALEAAAPDLKYHLREVKVAVEVQAALFHKG